MREKAKEEIERERRREYGFDESTETWESSNRGLSV